MQDTEYGSTGLSTLSGFVPVAGHQTLDLGDFVSRISEPALSVQGSDDLAQDLFGLHTERQCSRMAVLAGVCP